VDGHGHFRHDLVGSAAIDSERDNHVFSGQALTLGASRAMIKSWR
jgi:hypothetical protein